MSSRTGVLCASERGFNGNSATLVVEEMERIPEQRLVQLMLNAEAVTVLTADLQCVALTGCLEVRELLFMSAQVSSLLVR